MKKLSLFTLLSFLTLSASAQFESAPAFPGAEGFGRFTTGGRGGKVIHVTNLNDSGAGSLREALNGTGKKIIVFDVSGYIDLKSQLNISSNTTILGQTAPGDGITLRYYTLYFGNCDNVIVRYIRCRRSQLKDVSDSADATWGRKRKNIIIDHCSFSWSIDEVASFYDNRDFTLQWCTMGEALANPGHSKGEHSYGGIWGGKNASFHHNFLCHMQNRTPRFNGARYEWDGYDKTKYGSTVQAERVDFRNCVMYNWGSGNGCYGGPGGGFVNMVNNYYKAGPGTANKTRVTQISKGESGNSTPDNMSGMTSLYYIKGNYVTAASKPENYDWSGVKYDQTSYKSGSDYYSPDKNNYYGDAVAHTTINGVKCVKIKLDKPIESGYVTTHSAQTAFDKLLLYAGASYRRDAVDARYMDEAANGTTTYTGSVVKRAGIIDFVNAIGASDANKASFPELAAEKRDAAFDSDNDGMPDDFEIANELNPKDASDATIYTLDEKKYYTNIEVYANSLVEDLVKAERADAESSFDEYYPAINLPSSIETLPAVAKNDNAIYNLAGQRVSESYRGVVIQNGKKYYKK